MFSVVGKSNSRNGGEDARRFGAGNHAMMFPIFFWIALESNLVVASDWHSLAILHVTGRRGTAELCALYNPYFSSLPATLESTAPLVVYEPKDEYGCEEYADVHLAYNASTFLMTGGNCSDFDKLKRAYQAHCKQVVVVSSSGLASDLPKGSADEYKQVHLPVGMVLDKSFHSLKDLGLPLFVQLYHPDDPFFDPNIVVLAALAIFTVFAGAYWSGCIMQKSMNEEAGQRDGIAELDNENNLPITTVSVVVFVVLICVILVLLYFFYKYLVYVVIVMFALGAAFGAYECLTVVLGLIPYGKCIVPENRLPLLKSQPQVRLVCLFLLCAGLSIVWIVKRNSLYAWVLQDLLGICFCISLIRLVRLPNLKISTILLLALLLYDVFFVFITPFFSARGKSVMVEVATGRGNSESLPMVLKIPKIYKTAMSLCERPFSLLGFGDILLPGLFVAFCHNFDVIARTRYKIYFLATICAYTLGLVATFVALMLLKVGQPALLYLAPSILLACVLVGWRRGELKALWIGKVEIDNDGPDAVDPPAVTTSQSVSTDDVTMEQNPDSEKQKLIN